MQDRVEMLVDPKTWGGGGPFLLNKKKKESDIKVNGGG